MRKHDEEKYVELFKNIRIGEGFYFSYTYDLTHTLQNNVLKQIKKKTDDGEKVEAVFEQEKEESSDSEDGEAYSNYRSQSNQSVPQSPKEDRNVRQSLHQHF